jgi:hypothetical protein
MKKNLIILIIVVVLIAAGLVIYIKLREEDQAALHACWSVYKTNEDYSGLYALRLLSDGRIVHMHGITHYKLDRSYSAFFYGCIFWHDLIFVNLSVNESAYAAYNYDMDYFLNKIVDDDPFTEYYLCGVSVQEPVYFEELNDIINNNELDIRCEKKK